jgi:hypothetical protein
MTRWKLTAIAVLVLGLAAAPRLAAQTPSPSQTAQPPQAPAASQESPAPQPAKPADVASADAILAAVYDIISGPVGQKRDWERFRTLYLPGARLIPTGAKKEGGGFSARVLSPDDYVARVTPYFEKESFYEKETARRMERFGNIVHIFSTYESRHDPKEAPFARGINSFQLFFDGARWWIVSTLWQAESPEFPIPKEFLPSGN